MGEGEVAKADLCLQSQNELTDEWKGKRYEKEDGDRHGKGPLVARGQAQGYRRLEIRRLDNVLANATINSLCLKQSSEEARSRQLDAANSGLVGICPKASRSCS